MRVLGYGYGLDVRRRISPRIIVPPYDPIAALGDDLLAWWDAEHTDLITLVGSTISAWADRRGGYTVTQGTSASRPIYSETGFRGRPGVVFDGIDDCLSLSSAPLPTGTAPAEVWSALTLDAPTDETGTKTFLGWGSSNFFIRHFGRATPDGVSLVRALSGDGASNFAAFLPGPYQGRHVYRGLVSGTGVSVGLDGGDLSAETPGVSLTGTSRTRIGAQAVEPFGQHWPGTVGVIVVTKPLDDDKANALRNWLLNRI